MPAKSRRKKSKFSPQRRPQGEATVRQAAAQPVRTQPSAPSSPPMSKPRAAAPVPQGPVTLPIPHTSVSTELKTIGILAGALVVILVILAFVIH